MEITNQDWMLFRQRLPSWREAKRHPGVQLQLKRSELVYTLDILLNDGAITPNDLKGFSDGLMTSLNTLLHLYVRAKQEVIFLGTI